jgi:hypothetical protein
VRVSPVDELRQATLLHAGLKLLRETDYWEGFVRLVDADRRQRGFGDYLGYALVAEGKAEIYAETDLKAWDLAPCKVIVEEAGGASPTSPACPPSTAAAPSPPTAALHAAALALFLPAHRRSLSAARGRGPAGGASRCAGRRPARRPRRCGRSVRRRPRRSCWRRSRGSARCSRRSASVDGHVAFDALGLDALFVTTATASRACRRVERGRRWFGARDPVFRRR